VALADASLGAPLRLAIIAEDPALSPASDLLTAKLSTSDQLALVERAQLEKVYREQALAADSRDYLKLGQILGADGLLILRVTTETEPQLLNVRLVAVHAGVALAQHDYPWPLDDLEQFAPAVAAQFAPMFPKLAVASRDAVPVSILNLRSAAANGDSEAVERQLTLLLYNRLMNDKSVFVLERRRLELLTEETQRADLPENAFWNGSFLVEGVIDKQGFNKDTLSLKVLLTPPDKAKAVTLSVSGPRTNLAEVVNDLGTRILGLVSKQNGPGNWDAPAEAQRFFEEAKWMSHWQMYDEAKAAAEAAWSYGQAGSVTRRARRPARESFRSWMFSLM